MRRYWAFYWPLAATAVMMIFGMQVFNGVLARYPDGEAQIATFAYALGVFLFFDIAAAFLPQLVTVYARSQQSRRQVWRFCLMVGSVLTLPVLFLGFTSVGENLLAQLYRIDGAMLAAVVDYLRLLAGIILVHVGQQFLTGLLVQAEYTGRVSVIGLVSVSLQIATAVYGFQAGWQPVMALCMAYWLSQLLNLGALYLTVRRYYRDPEAQAPTPSHAELWRYFWPVAISGMVFGLSRPLLFAFVSRVPEAVVTTAALRVGFDLMMMFQVAVNQFRHFFATFGTDGLAAKRHFMRVVTAGLVAAMALVVLTPLGRLVFGDWLGLEGTLYVYARRIAVVALVVPVLLAVRNYYHGILLSLKQTTAMALGSVLRIGAIASSAALLLWLELMGPVTAALAMVAGFGTEMLVAMVAARRLTSPPRHQY